MPIVHDPKTGQFTATSSGGVSTRRVGKSAAGGGGGGGGGGGAAPPARTPKPGDFVWAKNGAKRAVVPEGAAHVFASARAAKSYIPEGFTGRVKARGTQHIVELRRAGGQSVGFLGAPHASGSGGNRVMYKAELD